jgi:hypothetical protein
LKFADVFYYFRIFTIGLRILVESRNLHVEGRKVVEVWGEGFAVPKKKADRYITGTPYIPPQWVGWIAFGSLQVSDARFQSTRFFTNKSEEHYMMHRRWF